MTFTTDQMIAFGGFILMILQITNLVIIFKNKAEDPDKKRDAEIADLKTEVEKIKGENAEMRCQLDRSRDNLNAVKDTMLDSTRILMQAVQALITHEVDGNNTQGLKQSAKDIDEFVWKHFGKDQKEV